jgi:hypothetical protein
MQLYHGSDIYVSPYLSKEQIVSGTLTYALGMGKAIISTPYWYAQEMLADNRGLLVDFNDTNGFTKALLSLIENPKECKEMRWQAYDFGRKMTWKNVGGEYNTVFSKALKKYNLNLTESTNYYSIFVQKHTIDSESFGKMKNIKNQKTQDRISNCMKKTEA